MKKQRAFTLVELMVVMAVVAILATAGLAAYSWYIKKSRDTARAEIAQKLNTAVMSYAASNGGNPPATSEAFNQFLASSSEVFGWSSFDLLSGTLIEDPVGGKSVCLDAGGGATEPCAFNYTAYNDGTYAISYGVESTSSREGNFYKTTKSVVGANITTQAEAGAQIAVAKYGVYVWSAKYIGQPATQSNGSPANDDGIDLDYYSAETSVLFRSIRVDVVTSGSGNDWGAATISEGGACTTTPQCISWFECISSFCTNSDACERPGVEAGDVCADGTVYVTSTMRTTPSDVWQLGLNLNVINTACNDLWSYLHDDWYVPSYDQLLNYLYPNRAAIGNFNDCANFGPDDNWYSCGYQSSTPSGGFGWPKVLYFFNGSEMSVSNFYSYSVRCIRNV